jgi:hypothetical protein
MVKIYFAPAWGFTCNDFSEIFGRQTPNNSGKWGDIEVTCDKDEADYIIVQDTTSEQVDRSKVIFFGREPRYISYHYWDNCFKSFHHENDTSWLPQTWWVSTPYNELKGSKPNKTKNLSVIDSGKRMVAGHNIRLKVINELIQRYPNDVDVYGKITIGRQNRQPFKYVLPPRSKENGLLDYKYTLVCENGRTNNYFSEKIADPLLCWVMPIYWGCTNIHKYLPSGSYINIDINEPNVVDRIIEISKSDLWEQNLDNIKEARELMLDKYNIWPTIERSLETDNLLS